MSANAIFGLLALNCWLLLVGTPCLYAIRELTSWAELVRLSGLAYMLGVSVNGLVWAAQLMVGVELSLGSIFATGLAIALCALVAGHRLGRSAPSAPSFSRSALPSISTTTAIFGALMVVFFEALFRAGRLAGLYEFDAWYFWVPKAKAIYFFGDLDPRFLHDLPHQSYPPLVPALEAAAFHFMGSADVVTLHLQFWFLLVGCMCALLGILSGRVPSLALWPPLLLVIVTPQVVTHALQPQADFLLDECCALGALLVGLWVVERGDGKLLAAAIFLGAAMLTKRDGYLFTAAVFGAAAVASFRQARSVWVRPLLAGGVAAMATVLPWRIFLVVHDLSGEGPEAGGTGLLTNIDRALPSLRLALSTLFDFHVWLIVLPLFIAATVMAFAAGARPLSTYASLFCVLCVAGLTWTTWAFPSLPISKETLNPIVRLTGGLILPAAALVPLLLASRWPKRRTTVQSP